MFKRSLVFAAGLLLGLVLAPGLHAQAREWVMPPNVVDFSTSPPTTHLLPALTQPTDPFQDPYSLANGAFDSGGKLLFYVRQGKSAPKLDVFDGSGKKIDQLAGASDSLQISVVPVPLSCDQKYYIIYFTRQSFTPHSALLLTYSIFDAQLGAITSRDVQIGPGRLPVTPGSYFGTTAVSPLRSGATRFLYAVNNDVVDKFLIDPSGISFANRLATSQSGYRPIQAVLSSDGSKLALGTPDGILVVTLDIQGDLGDSSVVTNPPVSGLAFSRDGSMLFFGDANGIEYFHLDDPSTVVPLPDSGGYANSQLELAVDDKIYAAGFGLNDDPDLGAIDPLGPIPSFTLTAVPGILGGNFPGVFSLPAQIAGEPLCGNPGLVQSSIGHQGNFELVVPDSSGGLAHSWRNNDNGNSWNGPNRFGAEVGAVDAVSMIWSNYGHLEVVARIGDRLAHFWRDSTGKWIPPTFFATGVSGTPSLIQGTFGIFPPGNFELVAPLAAGGIAHYWRDAQLSWYGDFIPSSTALPGPATDVSLIQSTLGVLGNDLQMTARVGDQIFEFSRNYLGIWSEPKLVVAAGASGTPSLIQGNFANPGGPGNFELVTPLAKGGMAHYWRDSSNYWHGPNPFADGNVRSVSLIQSNYGQDFEVVVRRNCGLAHYSRSDAQASSPWTWSGATIIVP